MLIGYFDYIVIVALLYFNTKYPSGRFANTNGYLIGFLLFGIILPCLPQFIEVQYVKMTKGIMDNFEVLYTFFRFPLYWVLGIVQLIITLRNKS